MKPSLKITAAIICGIISPLILLLLVSNAQCDDKLPLMGTYVHPQFSVKHPVLNWPYRENEIFGDYNSLVTFYPPDGGSARFKVMVTYFDGKGPVPGPDEDALVYRDDMLATGVTKGPAKIERIIVDGFNARKVSYPVVMKGMKGTLAHHFILLGRSKFDVVYGYEDADRANVLPMFEYMIASLKFNSSLPKTAGQDALRQEAGPESTPVQTPRLPQPQAPSTARAPFPKALASARFEVITTAEIKGKTARFVGKGLLSSYCTDGKCPLREDEPMDQMEFIFDTGKTGFRPGSVIVETPEGEEHRRTSDLKKCVDLALKVRAYKGRSATLTLLNAQDFESTSFEGSGRTMRMILKRIHDNNPSDSAECLAVFIR